MLQYFLCPLLLRPGFISTVLSNALYGSSLSYYHYTQFLGYSALPFLDRTEFFLYPIAGAPRPFSLLGCLPVTTPLLCCNNAMALWGRGAACSMRHGRAVVSQASRWLSRWLCSAGSTRLASCLASTSHRQPSAPNVLSDEGRVTADRVGVVAIQYRAESVAPFYSNSLQYGVGLQYDHPWSTGRLVRICARNDATCPCSVGRGYKISRVHS